MSNEVDGLTNLEKCYFSLAGNFHAKSVQIVTIGYQAAFIHPVEKGVGVDWSCGSSVEKCN